MDYRKICSINAVMVLGAFSLVVLPSKVLANNYGEDGSWEFQTSTDQGNMANVATLIQQKQAHMFQAPVYNTTNNTTIEHQTNCSVSSTVYGNYGSNTQGGNSSSSTGAQLSSTGNTDGSTVSQDGSTGLPVNLTNGQTNSGQVGTTYSGNTTGVNASGTVNQALNSSQTNSGTQSASVSGSTACSGALN